MHCITIGLLALVASVVALPSTPVSDGESSTGLEVESAGPCGALSRKAVCCKKSLVGLLDFVCHRPKGEIHSGLELQAVCAAQGKVARCCLLGVLGTYVACRSPQGVQVAGLEYSDDAEDNLGVVTAEQ